MDENKSCTNTSVNTDMKSFQVNHGEVGCDLNPPEEIVIQMDDDGYSVTTSTTADILKEDDQNLSRETLIDKESANKASEISSTSVNRDNIHDHNNSAPEGFTVEVNEFGDKIYKCKCCDYSSSKKTALLRDHYNHEHKKKVLECTECTYSTLRYKTLQQHRQNRHGLLAMECSYESEDTKCTFRSILEDVMIEHCATKHGIHKQPSRKNKEIYDRNILMKYKREGPDGKPVRRPHKHRLDRSRRVFDTIREENENGVYTYT